MNYNHRRALISPTGHTCPVCHRTDIRLKQNGKLFQHSHGLNANFGMIHPSFSGTFYKVCKGSGMPPLDSSKSGENEYVGQKR